MKSDVQTKSLDWSVRVESSWQSVGDQCIFNPQRLNTSLLSFNYLTSDIKSEQAAFVINLYRTTRKLHKWKVSVVTTKKFHSYNRKAGLKD